MMNKNNIAMNVIALYTCCFLYDTLATQEMLLLDVGKEPPQDLVMETIGETLHMRWLPPPHQSEHSTLEAYRVSYHNFTTDLGPDTRTFSVDLKSSFFKPCLTYVFKLAAIYNDSTYASSYGKMNYKPGKVSFITCKPHENETAIEISWTPSNDVAPCPTATFLVSAYGTQLLDNITTEKIPEFEITTADTFYLEGLYPYAEYKIFVKSRNTFGFGTAMHCTARTKELVPGWVTNEKAVCTSKTSISVSWTPPQDPNGKILRYWIKITRSKDYSVSHYEVEGEYTRANIQNLNQGNEYTFVIWPENGAGNGTSSDTLTVFCF